MHAWGLWEQLLLLHRGDKEVLVAVPFLSKACFLLKPALKPFLMLYITVSSQTESQPCREQQVLQESLSEQSFLALTAAAAPSTPTLQLLLHNHHSTTRKQTHNTHCSGSKDISATEQHHSSMERHFVGEERPPSTGAPTSAHPSLTTQTHCTCLC